MGDLSSIYKPNFKSNDAKYDYLFVPIGFNIDVKAINKMQISIQSGISFNFLIKMSDMDTSIRLHLFKQSLCYRVKFRIEF